MCSSSALDFGSFQGNVSFFVFIGVVFVEESLTGDDLLGELLAETTFFPGVALFVAFSGDASFAGVTAFVVFSGEAFFAGVAPFEGEVFFVTLPVCTWSAAASCALTEGTVRLGELLVVRSGLADFDLVGLAGDALVDSAGEVLRPAFAGVPSARDFAMVESISCILVNANAESREFEVKETNHGNARCCGAIKLLECGMHSASISGVTANKSKQLTTTANLTSTCSVCRLFCKSSVAVPILLP
jgi:hypothetical protein